jgi:hypothetical protein
VALSQRSKLGCPTSEMGQTRHFDRAPATSDPPR